MDSVYSIALTPFIDLPTLGAGFAQKLLVRAMQRLTRLLAEFGFEALGLIRLELVIEPQNTASQRVAEKAGAKREGLLRNRLTINGKSRDAWMYSFIRNKAEGRRGGGAEGRRSGGAVIK